MEPIELHGWEAFISELGRRYMSIPLTFTFTERNNINFLLQTARTSTMIVGVFDKTTKIGKIFDRRNGVRCQVEN